MNYRKFGNTDLLVSEIGFGAWTIGGPAFAGPVAIGWGDTDDATSIRALEAAFSNGINFYDTADFYGLGHSEELIGNVFGNNPDAIIATKVGHRLDSEGNIHLDYSYDHIIHACEKSLKRLKREAIDYYQLHSARLTDLESGECIQAMQDLEKEGKVRYWGISLNTYNPEPEFNYFLQNKIGNGFQVVLNILNQVVVPFLPAAADNSYGIIARMPLQFGLLTGRFNRKTRFNKDDHRATRLNPEVLELAEEYLLPLWDLAAKYETLPGNLALSFILSFQQVSTVIPGIRNEEQVLQNSSDLIVIDEPDLQFLKELYVEKLSNLLEEMKRFG